MSLSREHMRQLVAARQTEQPSQPELGEADAHMHSVHTATITQLEEFDDDTGELDDAGEEIVAPAAVDQDTADEGGVRAEADADGDEASGPADFDPLAVLPSGGVAGEVSVARG